MPSSRWATRRKEPGPRHLLPLYLGTQRTLVGSPLMLKCFPSKSAHCSSRKSFFSFEQGSVLQDLNFIRRPTQYFPPFLGLQEKREEKLAAPSHQGCIYWCHLHCFHLSSWPPDPALASTPSSFCMWDAAQQGGFVLLKAKTKHGSDAKKGWKKGVFALHSCSKRREEVQHSSPQMEIKLHAEGSP